MHTFRGIRKVTLLELNEQTEINDGQAEKSSAVKELYDWMEAIIVSLVVVSIICTYIFRIIGVGGVSMENTLNKGVVDENQFVDRVLITHLNYTPKRGDIVVISTPAVKLPIIKRVIAVGGDTVNVDFDKHTVSVNNEVLDEPYIKDPTSERGDVEFPVTVPTGHVFVMGDNRNDSYDSRFSAVGMIDVNNILGKAFLRIYPLNQITPL